MDPVLSARRPRPSRTRRRFTPTRPEALEGRALLALTLLQDINPAGLVPAEITGAGGKIYFVTRGPRGASDLDVETATGVTTLKEFPATNDAASAVPEVSLLTPFGSKLFFVADDGQGQQLWLTDGTSAGTRLVKDFGDGGTGGDLTVVGHELDFTALVDAGTGFERLLFQSDGTAAGTVPVATLAADAVTGYDAISPVSYDGALYFGFGDQLMKADGATTTVVGTFGPPNADGVVSGFVGDLTVAGGALYFTFPDASGQGEDLYATDGTAGGTRLLNDFVNASAPDNFLLSSITAVGSRLFFAADDAAHGPGLWVSDGTPSGTRFVKAFGALASTGAGGVDLGNPPLLTTTAAGNRLFFTTAPALPGATGMALWVSDGTAAGTTVLADINPGNTGPDSFPDTHFAALNGTLVFANGDPAHGVELWRSDGTARGTRLFRDLVPGQASSFPANLAVVNDRLYFSAGAGALWSSDGTAAGTREVARFPSQPDGSGLFDNIPDAFAVIGNTMVFADDDGTATELWRTDGTRLRTRMVKVLTPGLPASTPGDFTTVGARAFFDTTQAATETLWVTDGTSAGTTAVATFDGSLADLMAFGGKLAFIETAPDGRSSSLWLSDGSARGTTRVRSFPSDQAGFAETPTMAVLGDRLYISAPPPPGADFTGFFTLWVSDGTTAGTVPIADAPATANVNNLAVYQGRLYFSVDTPDTQLWVTDGAAAGTRMVTDMGLVSPEITALLAAGPNLYIFAAYPGPTGAVSTDLYRSNGTAGGTVMIHRFENEFLIASAALPSGRLALDLGGSVNNPPPQLWVSDGTAAGTQAVSDVGGGLGNVGTGDGALTAIGGRFFFQGTDAAHGTELWESDGTVAGTTLVQDINPGSGSSTPFPLTELTGRLIVAADDGVHGLELLSGPMPPAPATRVSRSARR
jgi:ELWxxDGT repeat protein